MECTRLPNTLKTALKGIAGSALFVGGSISSSWASICLLQRIIPQGRMLRSRFILNGTACVPWMLVLPESRRGGLSMYFFRMVLFNLINLYKTVYGSRGMRYVFETCCPGGHATPKIGYKKMTMLILLRVLLTDARK
jgi:hypothetical protein